jgi:hypothetical protein
MIAGGGSSPRIMTPFAWRSAVLGGLLAGLLSLAVGAGCAGIKAPAAAGGGGGGGGGHTVTGGPDAGTSSRAGAPGVIPDSGSCVKTACTPPGGRYCGVIGDSCGGSEDCGTCPGDQICEKSLCVAGASCVPATCPPAGSAIKYCGMVGDGCGRPLDCGACAAGQDCRNGICVDPGCVPLTCNAANGFQYCGDIGDGCGGTLHCTCSTGTCGGGGILGVCGSASCPTAITCNPVGGGQYCGTIGNGCGGILQCGACPAGAVCPANGVCPGSTTTVCQNLQCQIQTCTPTTKTSISGTVFDPAGKIPLYNALVYIPNAPLDPVPEGVSCDKCSVTLSGFPIATALSDAMGHFTLTNVPSGANIPLVIQVGKWRRQVTIPTVTPCVDNPVLPGLTHLPRDQSEGHLPKIAVTTGAADALECLLRRIGISDTEFTTDGGTGRVDLYAGGGGTNSFMTGGAFAPATMLWSDPVRLAAHDVLVMSCEGSTSAYSGMKPQTSVDNVANYANGGGRLFVSHLHFYWLQHRLDFNSTAAYIGNLTAPGATSGTAIDLTVNQTFPKGAAFAQWLAGPAVAASTTLGTLTAAGLEHSVTGIVPPTTEWIYLPSNPRDLPSSGPQMRRSEQYLSFNTPVGTAPDLQCGRVVFTDIHIQQSLNGAGGDDSDPTKPFPSGCKTNLSTPQLKALEFLFFDLSACVQPDTQQPQPPLVPPPGIPTSPPPSVTPPPRVPPPPPPPPPPPIP